MTSATPAEPLAEFDHFRAWLERGFHGQMDYLERGAEARSNPQALLPAARTVVVCALNYLTAYPLPNVAEDEEPHGLSAVCGRRMAADGAAAGSESDILSRISRYAWGLDYHGVVRRRLKRLKGLIETRLGRPVQARLCVDTAPLLERALAARAGLGWIGKNNCLIHPRFGSFLFLGELLLDAELECGAPTAERCGRCERCLQACPTGALVAPRCLDARRCIAYQTIESKSGQAPDVRGYLYGCDICQNVCPWNIRAQSRLACNVREFWPLPHLATARREDLDFRDETAFRSFFRRSVIRRIGLARWKANLLA
ncbi:MAG: tRNA epoxyqueuosine(34) reductase QueG [Candidatus Sumerlaeia bacterium]|nr:tRNA epoxyqueuosine(34) reductase QueG [Candidatus Sumerlaeia bacterium]